MIFCRHLRWSPSRLAPRVLPLPRNPSNPLLPSVPPCKPPSNFQQLTNCLKFATLFESLSFQSLTTIKFSKSFVLMTIRIARGWVYSPLPHTSLAPPSSLECAVRQSRSVTPLKCAVTKTPPRNFFRMRSSEKKWGGGGHSLESTKKAQLRAQRRRDPIAMHAAAASEHES